MRYFLKNQHGQSLIELSVTVSFVSVGLISILSLVLLGIIVQRRSSNYYTAVNLAREALEAARNIRDSNWLAIEHQIAGGSGIVNWNDNLHGDSNTYSSVLKFIPTASTLSRFSFYFMDPSALDNQSLICKKEDSPPTTIFLDCGSCSDCPATVFKRKIYLRPICDGTKDPNLFKIDKGKAEGPCPQDSATGDFVCEINGVTCDDRAPQIGIRSVVEISWPEGSQARSLKMTDDIYNWR